MRQKGSLTVEAALSFPVFFFGLLALTVLIGYIRTEYTVDKCMLETARSVSPYGEALRGIDEGKDKAINKLVGNLGDTVLPAASQEVGSPTADSNEIPDYNIEFPSLGSKFQDMTVGAVVGGITSIGDNVIVRGLLERQLTKYSFLSRYIDGGSSGVTCAGSELFTKDESIIIKCKYTLRMPISLFGFSGVSIRNSLEYRYFTGYRVASLLEEQEEQEEETEEEEEETVYITDTGKVYHRSLSCPSLKVIIRETTPGGVGKERNEAGGKYYACERCARGAMTEVMYITGDGDSYHYDRTCPGLKRTIMEVKLSEVGNRRECKRCGNK